MKCNAILIAILSLLLTTVCFAADNVCPGSAKECYEQISSAFARGTQPTNQQLRAGSMLQCAEFSAVENKASHRGDSLGSGQVNFTGDQNDLLYVSLSSRPRLGKTLSFVTPNGQLFANIGKTKGPARKIFFRADSSVTGRILFEITRNPAFSEQLAPKSLGDPDASVDSYGYCF